MRFMCRLKNDVGYLYKSIDADSVNDAIFMLTVKYPELDFNKKDIYVNAVELKNWFSKEGVFL